jgi:hypothetical protein
MPRHPAARARNMLRPGIFPLQRGDNGLIMNRAARVSFEV